MRKGFLEKKAFFFFCGVATTRVGEKRVAKTPV